MDKTYIVIYNIAADGDLKNMAEKLKSYAGWGKITETSWAIVSSKSSTEVRDELKEYVGAAGRLFVIRAGVGAAWKNSIASNEWLKKNL
jgi:hypothetical protein